MEQSSDQNQFSFDAVFDVSDYIYFYRESLTDERSNAEVLGVVNIINLDKPMKILDLACGFGRHANRLAALGHEVTGVDLSADFLDIARKEAKAQNLQVIYVQDDMRSIDYREEFDRVLLLFTAFGYFNDEENLLVIKNVYRALKHGGKFIFDVPNRDVQLKYMQSVYITEVGNDFMIDRCSFDSLTGRMTNRRFVIRDGERKEKPFSIRLYNANELSDFLSRAGFQEMKFFSTWEGLPVEAESPRLIVVTEK